MFGLAGLSLQIKIALVGSGRRSEDFRGPILSECRGCFTLQIDRFTMGGVKMINHRGKNSSKRSVSYKFKFHPIKKQKSRAKKSQFKISWLRRVWLHSTVPVTTTRENEMRKGKEIFGQKNHSIWLLSKLSWLFGLFWNKKTGCRRRIVNTEDLVAEDKLRLVSSCLGPSCQ